MLLQTPLPPLPKAYAKKMAKSKHRQSQRDQRGDPPVYEEVSIAHKYSRLWAVYFKMENNTITFIPNEQSVS